jgi:hypothetical protein
MPEIGNTAVFSQTDASNNTGTMPSWSGSAAPSTIDDAGRAFQGAVTREWNWRNFTVTATGTADAKVLTFSVAPAAYYNGQRYAFIANTTNTASATLNVNSLGAVTIKKDVSGTLTALSASDMVSGMFVEVAYNTAGSCFVWVNQTTANYFTTIELGNTSDTTISRSAAGVLAVEGGVIPKENRANTFTADQTINGASTGLLLNSDSDFSPQTQLTHAGATAGSGGYAILKRARGTYSAPSIVSSGDTIGQVLFQGHDGVAYRGAASILGLVDTTPGAGDMPGRMSFQTSNDGSTTTIERMRIDSSGNVIVTGSGGLGYGTGSGGSVTQITSRATGVTLNTTNGAITLFTGAPSAVVANNTFTVTNSKVAATDTIVLSFKSGNSSSNAYVLYASAVAAGSFNVAVFSTAGTTSDTPVINFAIIKAVTA